MHASKSHRFLHAQDLVAHTRGVRCLAAFGKQQLLASGGEDGVFIWDLRTYSHLPRPGGSSHRGATTAILWIERQDDPDQILVFGTECGFLVLWRRKPGFDFEEIQCICVEQCAPVASSLAVFIPSTITSLAWDKSTSRLAVCTTNGLYQVHTLQRSKFVTVFSNKASDFCAVKIEFAQVLNGGDIREILVFGGKDGRILTVLPNGDPVGHRTVGSRMGSAALNAEKNYYLIDVPEEGVALFRLDDTEEDVKIWTFIVPWVRRMLPRDVSFISLEGDDDTIVSGSDHDKVFVFVRGTREQLDVLNTGFTASQNIATAVLPDKKCIFIADRFDGHSGNPIQVWVESNRTMRVWHFILTWYCCISAKIKTLSFAILMLSITISVAVPWYISPRPHAFQPLAPGTPADRANDSVESQQGPMSNSLRDITTATSQATPSITSRSWF